jgi:peptidoglycan/xylan/chitin deacetylase (PgdA/CDA1 family)
MKTLPVILSLALLVAAISLADSRLTEALKLESVALEADGEGYAWPDSPLTVTFNRPLPDGWLERSLRLSPPVAVDVSVVTTGRWFGKTRLTINPSGADAFATDSAYRVYLAGTPLSFHFETIPTPRVTRVEPSGIAVKTAESLVLVFDRPMSPSIDIGIGSTPEVALEPLWYGDRALVLGHPRLRTATLYQFALSAGIEDAEGHPMQDEVRFSFRTVDTPTAAESGPRGKRVGLRDPVRVTFSTDVDTRAVEDAFRLEPRAEGAFDWPDTKTLVWRPDGLRPAQSYRVRVGGLSKDGDPIVPAEWEFRTTVPPPRITAGGGGKLLLTFDDDPLSAERGYALLDVLARYRVRAIFFPTGAWADGHPGFTQRAKAEGHLICNHTYGHAKLTALSEEAVRFQIVNGAGAGECDLLRPPYLAHNRFVDSIAASLGYRIFIWDVDSRDWEGLSAEEITNLVLGDVRPGAVVLFHMHAAHTLEALPTIIERLQGAGYVLAY